MPVRYPGPRKIQQQHQAEHQQPFTYRQPDCTARAGVGVSNEVVQDQHADAAKQQAVDQRLVLAGRSHDRGLQADIGSQLVLGDQPQVDVEGFAALRQWQHEVAAGQWPVSLGLFVARNRLLDQLVAVQHIHIKLQQVGCEYSQQLFMLAWSKTKT
ncbi:hypothetical protein D3C76_893450 [compost metagenome]